MEAWIQNPVLLEADKGAEYHTEIHINMDEIKEPVLCAPNDPDDAVLLSSVAGKPIDEVFIGSCMTNIGHFRGKRSGVITYIHRPLTHCSSPFVINSPIISSPDALIVSIYHLSSPSPVTLQAIAVKGHSLSSRCCTSHS